jgi:hypothetical protein
VLGQLHSLSRAALPLLYWFLRLEASVWPVGRQWGRHRHG